MKSNVKSTSFAIIIDLRYSGANINKVYELGMKYACKQPLKMISAEPIIDFMESNILPLI